MNNDLFSETKGETILGFPHDYVVVDTETTGLKPDFDEIIEITAHKYKNNIKTDEFSALVRPQRSISEMITDITGITNTMVARADDIQNVIHDFHLFVDEEIILGYNIDFDLRFINKALRSYYAQGLQNDSIDVLKLAKLGLPSLSGYKQTDVAAFLGITTTGAHRAAVDCEICNSCYQKLKAMHYYDGQSSGRLCGEAKPLHNKNIFLAGTFKQLKLSELQLLILRAGGNIMFAPTERVDYFIVGEQNNLEEQLAEYITMLKKQAPSIMVFKETLLLDALRKKVTATS